MALGSHETWPWMTKFRIVKSCWKYETSHLGLASIKFWQLWLHMNLSLLVVQTDVHRSKNLTTQISKRKSAVRVNSSKPLVGTLNEIQDFLGIFPKWRPSPLLGNPYSKKIKGLFCKLGPKEHFFYSYLRLNLLHGFHKEIILESQRPLIHRRAWNVGLLYRELCDDSTLGQPLWIFL